MYNAQPKRIAVGFMSVAIVVATGALATGEVIKIVSPAAAEDVDGDWSLAATMTPGRIQFLFPAADFAGLPASHRLIMAFNNRGDQTQTQAVDWTFPDTAIWISTTDRDSSTLSAVFDENHGPNKTLVHDGVLTFPILGTGPVEGPRDFAEGMRLQTPFYYDPSQGNLLIEQSHLAPFIPNPSPTFDLQFTPGFSTVGTEVFDPAFPVGDLNSTLPVTQFEFAPLPGDFDLDGDVDAADLAQWQSDFGVNADSDADNDGDSDGADFLAWQRQFGSGPPVVTAADAVPEPATLLLIIVATAGIRRMGDRMRQEPVNA